MASGDVGGNWGRYNNKKFGMGGTGFAQACQTRQNAGGGGCREVAKILQRGGGGLVYFFTI